MSLKKKNARRLSGIFDVEIAKAKMMAKTMANFFMFFPLFFLPSYHEQGSDARTCPILSCKYPAKMV